MLKLDHVPAPFNCIATLYGENSLPLAKIFSAVGLFVAEIGFFEFSVFFEFWISVFFVENLADDFIYNSGKFF